jgi:hypothetical protein
MIPKKLAPHLMRGGCRFSEKIMLHEETNALTNTAGIPKPAPLCHNPDAGCAVPAARRLC